MSDHPQTHVAPIWVISRWALAAIAVLSLGILASDWKALGWLWKSWTELPEFSHGPVMPCIAAFLVWQRSATIEREPFVGSVWGVCLVGIAGIALLAGTVGAVYTLQQYALVVLFYGLLLAWTGRAAIRHFTMAFAVLLMMVPQPEFILNRLSDKLQLISSGLGVAIIRIFGISVFLEGNVIDLGTYRLQVVEACAGLRYLFPLMTIGVLVAYFFHAPQWKRWLVFLASIPVTIAMNSFRIATVGLMVDRWGIGMAEGFIHDFQGWVVFMLSTAILIGLAAALHRLDPNGRPWREVFGIDLPVRERDEGIPRVTRSFSRPAMVAAALTVAVCVIEVVVPERPPVIPHHPALATFPLTQGVWRGTSQPMGEEVIAATALDDYFLANYQSTTDAPVSLYISYYDTQRDRRVVHSPAVCLPGSGWHIESSRVVRSPSLGFEVNRIVIASGENRAVVYYWFDQRGRFVTNEWLVKWYLFVDSLLTRKTYGAMVRVITPLAADEPPESADRRLDRFLVSARSALLSYIPR